MKMRDWLGDSQAEELQETVGGKDVARLSESLIASTGSWFFRNGRKEDLQQPWLVCQDCIVVNVDDEKAIRSIE